MWALTRIKRRHVRISSAAVSARISNLAQAESGAVLDARKPDRVPTEGGGKLGLQASNSVPPQAYRILKTLDLKPYGSTRTDSWKFSLPGCNGQEEHQAKKGLVPPLSREKVTFTPAKSWQLGVSGWAAQKEPPKGRKHKHFVGRSLPYWASS